MKTLYSLTFLLLLPLSDFAQIIEGVPNKETKVAGAAILACRDVRFRMTPDCENLVYVEKVNINGEDKDVVYNKKSGTPYSGSCKVCHNNGNLWMYLTYKGGWSYGIDTVYYENGNINLIRSHDIQGLGKEDGTWSFFRENGSLKWEKTYIMGAADGEQRYYFSDSTLEKVEVWKMNQLNGKKQEFYPGGAIKKEIGYKNGEFDGTYITYFKDGKVESEQQFVKGKKLGPSSYYYETGVLFYTENHENGLKEGVFKRFYMTDRKWTVETYKNNLRHGLFEEYYDDDKSTIKYTATYKKGKLISEQYYDEFGKEVAAPVEKTTPTEGSDEGDNEEGGKKKNKNKK